MNKPKKSWIIAVIVIVILVLTNPTKADFKDYLTVKDYYNKEGGRINYFGIFSLYKADIGGSYTNSYRLYLGIFKNFIMLKSSPNDF